MRWMCWYLEDKNVSKRRLKSSVLTKKEIETEFQSAELDKENLPWPPHVLRQWLGTTRRWQRCCHDATSESDRRKSATIYAAWSRFITVQYADGEGFNFQILPKLLPCARNQIEKRQRNKRSLDLGVQYSNNRSLSNLAVCKALFTVPDTTIRLN